MSQQKQAPLPRQEFQEWLENAAVPVLVLQKGKHLGSVVKVPATPEIDYLFGCETFYGERISWSDRLEFCGLYDRQHQALHLLDDPLPNFVSGLTEEECQDSTAFGKRIAQEVDRYVEAAISNERSRLSVRELTSERNINSYAAEPTRTNASEFITRALEDNYNQIAKKDNYLKYIATRPRAQRVGSHGLFTGEEDQLVLAQVAEAVAAHPGKGGNLLKQKVQFKQQILLAQPKGIQGLKRQKPIPCRPVLFHRKLKGRNQ